MLSLVLLGFAVGVDNLRVGFSIGMLDLPNTRRNHLALAFGFFEALMPLLGLLVGHAVSAFAGQWTDYFGPIVLGGCGIYLIFSSFLKDERERIFDKNWMLLGLPLSLSFDNLLAGIGLGMLGFQILISVLVIGLMSSFLSYLGLWMGHKVANYLDGPTELASGVTMIAVALIAAIFQ